MAPKNPQPVPVNLIAGPLGAGKTTTINHLLAHRPEGELWAVLVNEYGLVGLDAALITPAESSRDVEVKEVAGGCICCTAGLFFEMSLVLLLRRRPDRLLIEPTGLAELSGILDTLERPGIREAVDLRSVITILDPAKLDEDLERDEVRDQIEAADLLLASRADLAAPDQVEAFERWAQELFPPKRFVGTVERGRLSLELLDLVSARDAPIRAAAAEGRHLHRHGDNDDPSETEVIRCSADEPIVRRGHRSAVASTIGWVCWNELIFDAELTLAWLLELAQRPGVRRTKAALRTSEGWRAFNAVDGVEERTISSHRRDSRLEIVLEGDAMPDPEALERQLRGCLVSPPD